jgi:hypothetical protein
VTNGGNQPTPRRAGTLVHGGPTLRGAQAQTYALKKRLAMERAARGRLLRADAAARP